MGQGVGGGRGAQQLLRAAAGQTVLTAEWGAHTLGRGLYATTVAAKRAGGRAGSLTDGGAWHNRKILPKKKKKKRGNKRCESPVCKIKCLDEYF